MPHQLDWADLKYASELLKIDSVCTSFHLPIMIFDIIRQQVEILRRPLAAVVLSTVPRRYSPSLLLLHWHGFGAEERHRPPSAIGVARSVAPLPSSALQLNRRWGTLEEIDHEMLEAAWQLGAWDLVREEHRACSVIGASAQDALACRQAFGDNPFAPDDEGHLVAEAPERGELRDAAARVGYVRWAFRPVAASLWQEAGMDDSLLPDGRRLPPCPVAPRSTVGTQVSCSRYQLGRIDRVVLL
ncbi:MAG: diguanylate cyclase [Paucibacter sp.]|nr:diguanylate cyclase [Roseateles sp.]